MVVFALTRRGLSLAAALAAGPGTVEVLGPSKLVDGGLKKEARKAFGRKDDIVFISAVGIAVRTIAPLLRGKLVDPAVVVMDERGRFAISLLSGHMGGANELAGRLARSTGAVPVITTATDVWGLASVEGAARRFALAMDGSKGIKAVNSAILEGKRVFWVDSDKTRAEAAGSEFGGAFTRRRRLPKALAEGQAVVLVTSRIVKAPEAVAKRTVVLRPRDIVAGIGCGRGVKKAEIKRALDHAFNKAGLSTLSIRNIATIDIKKDEKGLRALARELGVPIEAYGADELGRVRCPSRPSMAVFAATGTGAVSEPAAMLSSGEKRLCLRKTKKGHVTVAAALVPSR